MVSSQYGDSISEAYFQTNQQSDCLNGIVASINIITHKEVICVGTLAPNLKQLNQIVELSMNITAHSDRTAHKLNIRLRYQNFFSLNHTNHYLLRAFCLLCHIGL